MVIEGRQIILQESDHLQELLGFENMLLKDVVDSDYKYLEQRRAQSSKMLRSEDEEDDDEDEEDDPDHRLILQNLKEHDMSYRIEYEEDGLLAFIKYEGASGSDTECDEEPRQKLRKQKDGSSNQMPRADTRPILDSHYTPSRGMKMLPSRQTRSKTKGERQENAKSLAKHKVPVPVPAPAPQNRRKLRSATKQVDEQLIRVRDADSRPTPTREMAKLTRKEPRSESSKKEEDAAKLDSVCHTSRKPERLRMKSTNGEIIQFEPDYDTYFPNFLIANDCYVGMFEGDEVAYEEKSGDGIKMTENDDDEEEDEDDEDEDEDEDDGGGGGDSDSDVEMIDKAAFIKIKEDDDDGGGGGGGGGDSDSDVEIIDKAAFDKKINGSNSNHRNEKKHSEFRHKVIAALKKPFDRKEYKKLLQLIKLHKIKERHMDLRGGRERPFGTQEYGKSYLDHHPG